MSNRDVADLLRQIAEMLEIKGEVVYKTIAYRRAADSIEALGYDIQTLWREGRLREVPGIGQAIAKKLDELFRTGRMEYYERLKEEVPPTITDLLAVPGIGPKTANVLWKQLGLTTIAAVERAARAGELRRLPGFGERSEQRVLEGIEALKRRSDRILLGTAWPIAQELIAGLRAATAVSQVEAAGSLRRMQATIGDVDLLAAAENTAEVTEAFAHLPLVAEVVAQGPTKITVLLHNGLQVDLRVVHPAAWGSALQYFTGSQAHNVELRELSQKKGLSLSEYGFKREGGGGISCASEQEVYETLGLPWIPPELREARGEIAAARKHKLPNLVQLTDIRGDLHLHSLWSDGVSSLEEMVIAAQTLGYAYLAVSDHTESLTVANGNSWESLQRQRREIDELQARYPAIRILQGAEVEIKTDGTLDFPDELLAQLDVVIASVHSGLRQGEEQITERVLKTLRNPHVDILGHPSGRLLGQREASAINLDEVIKTAAETGTILEVNSIPNRLDLEDSYIHHAVEAGVKVAVNSDAHSWPSLDTIRYGVAMARRGWAEVKDIVNTYSVEKLLALLRARG